MNRFRMTLTGLAVLAGLIIPAGVAQAATSAPAPAPHGHVLIAPPAPHGLAAVSAASAVAPTISPPVTTGHAAPGQTYNCASGDLCATVWDPTTSSYKIFFLNFCNVYALSNWNSSGNYYNNQTGSPTSYFYDQSFGILTSFQPVHPVPNVKFNWVPVWYIQNC